MKGYCYGYDQHGHPFTTDVTEPATPHTAERLSGECLSGNHL